MWYPEASSDDDDHSGTEIRSFHNPSDEAIRRLLEGVRRIAVVGLSVNPSRPSNAVAGYLRRHGYEIVPVNPNYPSVFGERSYPSLDDVPGSVDVVDVFRRSD